MDTASRPPGRVNDQTKRFVMSDLKLVALDEEDLKIISAHVQDAVLKVGDMTYYDVRLDGSAGFDGQARPVRIAMRNVFGREVQDVGTRANVSWSPGSLVLFR